MLPRMRWMGHVACMGAGNACRILVGKPKVKRLLGGTGQRWENDSVMNFIEV